MKITVGLKLIRALAWGEKDHARMVAVTGLKPQHVYRGDKPARWSIRKGELLGVFDLRAFGPERSDWTKGLADAVKNGGVVVEVEADGSLGAHCSDASGAVLMADTLRKIRAEIVMPPEKAKRLATARKAATELQRLDRAKAEKIWRNAQRYQYTADALAKMPGWSYAEAYRAFGARGVSPGRKASEQ